MGRTLPSATQVFYQEEQAVAVLRRCLGKQEQRVLENLFDSAHRHIAAVSYAAHTLPVEIFLLAMLLEQHKEVMRLKNQLEELLGRPLDPQLRDPRQLF